MKGLRTGQFVCGLVKKYNPPKHYTIAAAAAAAHATHTHKTTGDTMHTRSLVKIDKPDQGAF